MIPKRNINSWDCIRSRQKHNRTRPDLRLPALRHLSKILEASYHEVRRTNYRHCVSPQGKPTILEKSSNLCGYGRVAHAPPSPRTSVPPTPTIANSELSRRVAKDGTLDLSQTLGRCALPRLWLPAWLPRPIAICVSMSTIAGDTIHMRNFKPRSICIHKACKPAESTHYIQS